MEWLKKVGSSLLGYRDDQRSSLDDIQKDYVKPVPQEYSNCIQRYKIDKTYALLTGADTKRTCDNGQNYLEFVHKDLQRMEKVFRDLKFDVLNPCLGREKNVSRVFMFDECINDVNGTRDLGQYSCCLFYFSGHGDRKGVVLSNGDHATYLEIIQTFNGSSSTDTPKIFIFDCCRDEPEGASCSRDEPEGASCSPDRFCTDLCDADIPPNVLVVFACLPDEKTYGCKETGSYFTRKLENKLRAFITQLSFLEIILQVTGPEKIVVDGKTRDYVLNPFVICTLSKQLHFGESFMVQRPSFTSRAEVMDYLDTLGHGVKVLVCYSPDPKSAKDCEPEEQQAKRSRTQDTRRRIGRLACRLERHGFSVFTDLKGGDPLLKWYTNHIESDDYVLLVCSPAFEELFRMERLEGVSDWQAKLVYSYCNNIFGQLATNPDTRKKFIPVVIDLAYSESIPSLFRGSTLYRITNDKAFDYDSDPYEQGFDALVCRMAGIDRAKIEKELLRGPVVQVTGEGVMLMEDPEPDMASYLTLKPGHKFVSLQQLSEAPQVPRLQLTEMPLPLAPSPPTDPHHQATPTTVPLPVPPPSASASGGCGLLVHLPPTPVNQRVFIWLSMNVPKWKFVARYLGMSSTDIENIEQHDRGDLREQCYQMLLLWHGRRPQGTYRDIGAAIAESSSNCPVLEGFAAEVQQVLNGHEHMEL